MAHISIQNVSVDFPLYHAESRSLKKTLFAVASGRIKEDSHHRPVVEALRHVSIDLKSGDRLGLIGANGAGKTTLLRCMAGIYEPFSGDIATQGAVTALLDPGQGMNPELTGRENIMLRGLFNGLTPSQIAQLQADVATFSELSQFLELPVRTYSSGMVVRLGFALATAMKPQILLMDEWILAGDASFMTKARHRLETMVRGAEILVLSTHSPVIIMQWCNRVIWMDRGRVKADGTPEEILSAYLPPDQFSHAMAVAAVSV
ncbi:MAG: ABC transporter ATP-binding protein [Acidocella sp. 20-57-95]|nr:MAG: ABC transporter ATP-binding protein [Acidocella sp. 20-57-95]HQT65278.1 ABC transporter ATP-binding protein [Acidocella sp.]HQU04653.1 ABC transporter ATP-binding protein [Acidocella sp.]